ncbi:MAG: 50S ribosomal protein L11 methyltransferase [Calditrichaeota bacterium]|nr:50S ribosomal protein L11 methyltransferase [Calditrichota bacterium]
MTENREYQEMALPLAGLNGDLLSALLQEAGCLGIQEVAEDLWTVYFPGDWQADQFKSLRETLQRQWPAANLSGIQLNRKPFEDWNAEWKKFFVPRQMVPEVWVRPPWEELPAEASGQSLIIDPQMAFGTGHHETTRLMMLTLMDHPPAGQKILDLGTGSGILAILAAKLGASACLGIDNDPEAIDNARHNAGLNQVAGVDFRVGTLADAAGPYDMILANIHFEVLRELATEFQKYLAPQGLLILSGLLQTDLPAIFDIYEAAGWQNAQRLNLNEWAALLWTPLHPNAG